MGEVPLTPDVDFAPGRTTAPDAVPGWAGGGRDALFSRLDELAALGEDWDGYGAHGLSPFALNVAGQVIDQLLRAPLPTPNIVPVPNGGVQLEWVAGAVELDLEVRPNGEGIFVCDDELTGEQLDGELPEDLGLFQTALGRLYRER